jgi:NAD(P)-dependent dehydrogenase (short-subunit alcohol dehydrogenase family)
MVEGFARQGARVTFLDIAEDDSRALAKRLSDAETPPRFLACDLTDIGALQAAIERIRLHFGPIGVLVNNAADDHRHDLDSVSVESFDSGVAVNLRHQLFAAQAVAPDMRALHGGSIINLGSISWMIKEGRMPVYTT